MESAAPTEGKYAALLGLGLLLAATLLVHAIYFHFDARALVGQEPTYLDFCRHGFTPAEPNQGRPAGVVPGADVPYRGVNFLLLALDATVGMSPWLFHAVCWLFLAVLTVGCFAVARMLGGEAAGYLAAVAGATLPHSRTMSREYFASFPASALLVCGAAAVMRLHRGPWRRGWALGIGALVGAAVLVHPIGMFFGAFVFAALAAVAWHDGEPAQRRRRCFDALLAAGLALAISVPFSGSAAVYFDQKVSLQRNALFDWSLLSKCWRETFVEVDKVTLAAMAIGALLAFWRLARTRPRFGPALVLGGTAAGMALTVYLAAHGVLGAAFTFPLTLACVTAAVGLAGGRSGRGARVWLVILLAAASISGGVRLVDSYRVMDPVSEPWHGAEMDRLFVSLRTDVSNAAARSIAASRGAKAIVAEIEAVTADGQGGWTIAPDAPASSFSTVMALNVAIYGRRFLQFLPTEGFASEPDGVAYYGRVPAGEVARALKAVRKRAADEGRTCSYHAGFAASVTVPLFPIGRASDEGFIAWCRKGGAGEK